jgi:hypothetical protein
MATDTEKIQPDPRMMQSVVEHQEVPKEDATVMPVGGLRKWYRNWNLTAGRHQKPKGRIQASCESRRRLTVAGRKTTRRARVAWRRKNVRKISTQGNCGQWIKLAAASRRMTRSAGVAWLRRGIVRKDCTRAKNERATKRVGPLRKYLRMHHEGKR